MSLARSQVMKEIVKIIGENISGIEALELSENKLAMLDALGQLTKSAPNVRILYLHNNLVKKLHLKYEKLY